MWHLSSKLHRANEHISRRGHKYAGESCVALMTTITQGDMMERPGLELKRIFMSAASRGEFKAVTAR